MTHGEICWSELMTRDVAAARAFYGSVMGWTFTETTIPGQPPYTVCHAGGRMVAGIMPMDGPQWEGVPVAWGTYVAVDDADAACTAAAAAGGRVVQPPFDVPTVGRIAVIADPTGAVVNVMKPTV